MPLYLERYVRPFGCVGPDVTTVHRMRVRCASGSFDGVSLAEAVKLCRPHADLDRLDRPWTMRILTDPNAP